MTDAVPLRDWLADRFDAIDARLENLEHVLVTGNGQPAVTQRLTTTEGRLDAHEALLAYDRNRIDLLRDTPKKAQVAGSRWGAITGGVVGLIASVLAELLGKPR